MVEFSVSVCRLNREIIVQQVRFGQSDELYWVIIIFYLIEIHSGAFASDIADTSHSFNPILSYRLSPGRLRNKTPT